MDAIEALDRLCSDDPDLTPPRTLLVVAHPDDDVVGAASRLKRLAREICVVYVTDGAPFPPHFHEDAGFKRRLQYADARSAEALMALGLVGIWPRQVRSLGVVDQTAAQYLPLITRALVGIAAEHAPDAVLTHAYEGGHPDHDAVAFAVHCAARLAGEPALPVLEFAAYHDRQGELRTYDFIEEHRSETRRLRLTPEAQALKQRLFSCHETQRAVLSQFPLGTEAFRVAPDYDFTDPPARTLYYERFDWGMRGQKFCWLARQALTELDP